MGLEKLNELRKLKGITIDELSKRSGIPVSTIKKISAGITTNPNLDTVKALLQAMGCSLADLESNVLDSKSASPIIPSIKKIESKRPEITYAVTTWKREYQAHADEYARLDDYGRKAVDAVTKVELERVKYEQEELDRVDYNNVIFISRSDYAASAGTGVYLGPESFSQIKVSKNNLTKKAKFAVPVKGNSMNPDFFDGDILLVGEEQPKMGDFGIFTLDGEGYVKMLGDGILIPMNTAYPNIPINESTRCNGKVLGILKPEWIVDE